MWNRRRSIARSLPQAALAVGLMALAGCVSTARRPAARLAYPSPLTGPGAPVAGKTAERALSKGFKALAEGRSAAALALAGRASPNVAADVLKAQAKLAAAPAEAEQLLKGVVARSPGYAAAWLTLSAAAEQNGDEKVALDAARRGASLWDAPRWQRRLAALENRLITGRLAQARDAIAAGDLSSALEKTTAVLQLEPGNVDAHLLRAQVLLAQGHPAEARAALDGIEETPQVIAMRGRIAEREHRWGDAMRLYTSLPPGFPGRREALTRAKNRWRISNLPAYVGEAINSKDLTRAQLAALLVDLVPEVDAMAGEPAPVLSDIVGLPEQREIIAAVRAGLVKADALEHRFFPSRQVSPAMVRHALDRLSHILGRPAPHWCPPAVPADGCLELSSPVSGQAVFRAMMPLLELGGS